MGGTTHKLRPSPYLLQVTSQTLFFPVQNYPPHTFRSERTPESHNLTVCNRHTGADTLLKWTLGHIGITGNEKVDNKAKRAVRDGSSL